MSTSTTCINELTCQVRFLPHIWLKHKLPHRSPPVVVSPLQAALYTVAGETFKEIINELMSCYHFAFPLSKENSNQCYQRERLVS